MIVLPNMGLVKWDQISDSFSHQQLASNFDAIDAHDHTPGKGKPIPAGGLAPLSVTSSNLQDNIFTAEKIVNGAITTDKIANAAVTDGKLASSNSGVHRTILSAYQTIGNDLAAGTYILGRDNGNPVATGGDTFKINIPMIFLSSTIYPVSNKSTKYSIRNIIGTNATAPTGWTATVALCPISAVAGGADQLTITLGSPVSGSEKEAAWNTSLFKTWVSSDFDIIDNEVYALSVTTTGTLPNNSAIYLGADLRVRHV